MTRDWLTAKEMDAADELVRQHDEAVMRSLAARHQPPRELVQPAGQPVTETYIPKEWPDAPARAVMARHNLRVEDLTYPPPALAKVVYAGSTKQSPAYPLYPIPEIGQFIPSTSGSSLRLRVTRKEFVEEEGTWYLYCEAVE